MSAYYVRHDYENEIFGVVRSVIVAIASGRLMMRLNISATLLRLPEMYIHIKIILV